uniref:Uncharacterized protein n=1 Tax=Rhabditophanes sp. KR3021 TaxID=114890 RepID=A0AC35TUJ8_9BILA
MSMRSRDGAKKLPNISEYSAAKNIVGKKAYEMCDVIDFKNIPDYFAQPKLEKDSLMKREDNGKKEDSIKKQSHHSNESQRQNIPSQNVFNSTILNSQSPTNQPPTTLSRSHLLQQPCLNHPAYHADEGTGSSKKSKLSPPKKTAAQQDPHPLEYSDNIYPNYGK